MQKHYENVERFLEAKQNRNLLEYDLSPNQAERLMQRGWVESVAVLNDMMKKAMSGTRITNVALFWTQLNNQIVLTITSPNKPTLNNVLTKQDMIEEKGKQVFQSWLKAMGI
jgi:hypothetical protein